MVPELAIPARKPTILLGVTSKASLRLIAGFAQFLSSKGWHVHLVYGGLPGEGPAQIEGVIIHELAMSRDPSPFQDLLSLVSWIRVINTAKPQVLFIGTPKAGLLGNLAGWISRTPVRVYHLRGLRLETSTGLRRLLLWLAELVTCSTANHILCVSNSLKHEVTRAHLSSSQKLEVVGHGSSNGISPTNFNSKAKSGSKEITQVRHQLQQNDLPVVGFVGRLSFDKGIHVLAKAAKELASRDVRFQLLLVGPVEDKKILDVIKSLDCPIALVGETDYPEAYYQLMDVFCLPTFREGFPNVVLEASLAEVPTVTTMATGARDSVVDRVTGLLVAVNSPHELAEALKSLLMSQQTRMKYGSAARKRALVDYEQRNVWIGTEAILRNELFSLPNWK